MNGRNNSGYRAGAKMLPGIKQGIVDRSGGTPAGRVAAPQRMGGVTPQTANAQKYAKGGAVRHKDEKQDKALIAKMLKEATGKKPIKRAAGGVAKLRKASPKPKPIKKVPLVSGG